MLTRFTTFPPILAVTFTGFFSIGFIVIFFNGKIFPFTPCTPYLTSTPPHPQVTELLEILTKDKKTIIGKPVNSSYRLHFVLDERLVVYLVLLGPGQLPQEPVLY